MTPANRRLIGNIVLAIAIAILVVDVLSMTGAIQKIAIARELNIVALVLVFVARALRGRRGSAVSTSKA